MEQMMGGQGDAFNREMGVKTSDTEEGVAEAGFGGHLGIDFGAVGESIQHAVHEIYNFDFAQARKANAGRLAEVDELELIPMKPFFDDPQAAAKAVGKFVWSLFCITQAQLYYQEACATASAGFFSFGSYTHALFGDGSGNCNSNSNSHGDSQPQEGG